MISIWIKVHCHQSIHLSSGTQIVTRAPREKLIIVGGGWKMMPPPKHNNINHMQSMIRSTIDKHVGLSVQWFELYLLKSVQNFNRP